MIDFTKKEIEKLQAKKEVLLTSESFFSGIDATITQTKIIVLKKLISDFKKHQKNNFPKTQNPD